MVLILNNGYNEHLLIVLKFMAVCQQNYMKRWNILMLIQECSVKTNLSFIFQRNEKKNDWKEESNEL